MEEPAQPQPQPQPQQQQDQQLEAAAAAEASLEKDMEVSQENDMQVSQENDVQVSPGKLLHVSGVQNVAPINESHSALGPQASHNSSPSFEPLLQLPKAAQTALEWWPVRVRRPCYGWISEESDTESEGEDEVHFEIPIPKDSLPSALGPQASHNSSPSFEPLLQLPKAPQAAPERWPVRVRCPCYGWISEESDTESEGEDEVHAEIPIPKDSLPSKRRRPSRWDVGPDRGSY